MIIWLPGHKKWVPDTINWVLGVLGMGARRLGLAAAALDGTLYALGGIDGSSRLSSVERYDPRAGAWSPVAPMGASRWRLAAAALCQEVHVEILDLDKESNDLSTGRIGECLGGWGIDAQGRHWGVSGATPLPVPPDRVPPLLLLLLQLLL